jgi:hypothetical protein
LWQEALAADWLEQQRHNRQNGTAPAAGGATVTATRPTLSQRLRLRPFAAQPVSPASGGSSDPEQAPALTQPGSMPEPSANGTPVPPTANGTQPGPTGNGAPPARPSPPPAPAPPATSTGGTVTNGGQPSYKGGGFGKTVPGYSGGGTVPSGTAATEQFVEGINRLHAEAATGGIFHTQAAIKGMNEGSLRFSSLAQMVSRILSEPGRNYGPEITEPLGKAAQYLRAAAACFGESDTNLSTLINMTVGDLARSPRQAPHHTEMTETGAH